ncbi:hypothetical protein CRUP_011715 [Coryphaenoides rupestris]|nr:hypothetical protein CRUP_011715 [Coryphaenoides rupestris]
MYAVLQTIHIPDELYKRVYDFCKRLLTFPQPYCSMGLSYSRQMKAERCTPGLMYQRMVVAEQSLKNEHYSFQERVFVFVDPVVFEGPLGILLYADIQASGSGLHGLLTPLDHMSSVIQHSIQAGLGPQRCHGHNLDQALRMWTDDVIGSPLTLRAWSRLWPWQRWGPSPAWMECWITLLMWSRGVRSPWSPEPEAWMSAYRRKELCKCVHSSSMSEQFSLSQDQGGALDTRDLLTPVETPRHSVMSVDSGIEA